MLVRCFFLFFGFFGMISIVSAQNDSIKRKNLLILPVIAKSIETGWSFGTVGALTFRISPKDTVSRTSNAEVLVLYSTKKQLVTAFNGTQYFHKEKFILTEQISFSSFPDKFWGLGKHSPDNAEEAYKFNQFYIYAHLLRKVAPHFFIGALFETQRVWNITYLSGGLFDQQQVLGREGYQVAGFGTSFTYDKRNNAFSPDNGLFCQLFINHFDKFWGSKFNYSNVVIDLRKYIPVSKRQVLAFQLYSFNNTGEVPIRSLASFGGANRMRGYYEGRYRALDQLVFQTEYRFPVYKRVSAVAFGGTGNVGNSFRDYSLSELKVSYGAGLRIALNKKERLNLRIDYGIGQGKNSGLYLQLGEAF